MHHDVISCVICKSNEVEYLEKEKCYKNSSKEVTWLQKKRLQKKFDKISLHRHFNTCVNSITSLTLLI